MRSEIEIKELVNFFKDNKFFKDLEKQHESFDPNKLMPDAGKSTALYLESAATKNIKLIFCYRSINTDF